ncbi:hypothetical protein CR513_21943, partial [Mucuna pruriens]
MLSMEFGDTLVQFNIFEAMKHPTHSLFGIDVIDELVAKHLQSKADSVEFPNFVEDIDVINYLGFVTNESDYDKLWEPRPAINISPLHSPPIELKPLLGHLKYAYLDNDQQFPIIIANNLHQEQHKKAIGWRLLNLPRINPSICMHRILIEEEAHSIRQQQRRLNLTILDVVKKEVTKLFAVGIIYPISDSQWVSSVQVVPKKSGMIVIMNQHDELRVCIDYRKLNQATRKDYFLLPFIDQILEKLQGKYHYCFLYMQIHVVPEDQHKTTFTCPFGTFAYTCMLFGLCNAPSTF